jgi:predicted ribosomally synthesized peptide with SipW-like signal peptide
MNKILASLLMIGVVAAMVGAGTWALFTGEATSTGNTFTSGSLGIGAGASTYSANIGNIAPGESATVTLDVSSLGTLPLDYSITPVLSGDIILGGANDPYVSSITVDGNPYIDPESLSEVGGSDVSDTVVVTITLPSDANDAYQGLNGDLAITFEADQQ